MNTDKSNKDYDILHKIVLIGDSGMFEVFIILNLKLRFQCLCSCWKNKFITKIRRTVFSR